MTIQSSLKRSVIAITAALLMSTVAVSSAVGPAQAAGAPTRVVFHA